MKKILFIRTEKAFLPEIDAYINFFNNTKHFRAYDSLALKNQWEIDDFDIIWEFKGFGGTKDNDKIIIHDYASLSVGSFPKIKDFLKSKLNHKPDLRLFLNQNVKDSYHFNDKIDYCYRDMGVDKIFFEKRNKIKEYDFVYTGSISKEREIEKLLERFTNKKNGNICLIGNVENEIYNKYKDNKDVIFTGKVPYSDVPDIASRATYGINYMPNKAPFNIQTSTKLLEYLALELKVITTNYKWVNDFEKKIDGSFYKLSHKYLDFNLEEINKFDYISKIKEEDFLWDNVIKNSNVEKKLKEICF